MEIMTTRHPRVKLASFLAALSLAIPTVFCNAQEAEPAAPADDPVAREIVEKADLVRFPNEGFQVDVSITSSQPDQENELWKYRVLSKGNSNTVVMVTEPASERGQIMLMKGRDLWVFMPDVSQPIRISLSQRLTGQVANGDLARANFASDYHPKLLRTETIDNETYNVLELIAVNRSVTYQKVVTGFGKRTTGHSRPSSIRSRTACSRSASTRTSRPWKVARVRLVSSWKTHSRRATYRYLSTTA